MEDESKPMCRAGCGFHADPATDGLCSLCFANIKKKTTTLAPNCQARHTTAKSFSSPSSCLKRAQFESNMAVAYEEAERHVDLLESKSLSPITKPSSSSTTSPIQLKLPKQFPSSATPPTTSNSMSKINKNYVVDLQINLKSNETQMKSVVCKKTCGNVASATAATAAAVGSGGGDGDGGDGGDSLLKIVSDKRAERCAAKNCRRKLSLTDFHCRCGRCFCPLHRYSDRHECTFNYREWGASEIQRKNPRIVGEKIRKI